MRGLVGSARAEGPDRRDRSRYGVARMTPTHDEPDATPSVSPPTSLAEQRARSRPWYLRPETAIWLGPVLVLACLGLRFGWGGIEGPPFPFWGIAYAIGAGGIFLTYVGMSERRAP
jgi:hypothetical protein